MTDTPKDHHDDGQGPESNSEPYKVGRGRPPLETRWKPNQSGNPSGRRKRRPHYGDLLNRILSELASGEENGKAISLTKAKAWVRNTVYRGAILGKPEDEDILLMFEKPWESAPTAYLEWILLDSEDDIPPRSNSARRA